MARKVQKRAEEVLTGSLTAMIDVVFQLIIFFVCTVHLQDEAFDRTIVLPPGPNGVETDDPPSTITIDVNRKGSISMARMPLTEGTLLSLLKSVAAESRSTADIPIVIRGDGAAGHWAVSKAMNACTAAGFRRISFAAMKNPSGGAE